jgi:AraC-like DNA-binding protein
METLHYLFRLLALSQVLFLSLYVGIFARSRIGILIAVTCLGFASYLASPFIHGQWEMGALAIPVELMAASIPALIWLLARAFFEDKRRIPVWFWMVWIGYILLWMQNYRSNHELSEVDEIIFVLLPQLIKLGFVVHVIVMAIQGRATDLVSQRLQLRLPIAIGAGSLCAIVILIEIWANGRVPMPVEVFGSVSLFVITLATNIYLFNLREDLPLTSVSVGQAPGELAVPDPVDTGAIESLMVEERFYANHGATIGDLASEIGVPEYRLRRTINQRMGYRNFNQFLNEYRIKEASERLLSESRLPVLTIALDVGFQSLSSFNKAFRDTHDCTPTAFRASQHG